ncbi:MAG: hypothetical protein JO360_05070 [Acidobacteria bacterium]|nr:hypothetical protein [Acidobacteriota bacterium]
MSFESIVRRIFFKRESSRLSEAKRTRLTKLALTLEGAELEEAVSGLEPAELTELAREVLRVRAVEALELLRTCEPCYALLSGGGYEPVALLDALRESIGRRGAQMDIDVSGQGGSQRGQGYGTEIRFGPREFLTGTSLDGMTVRESQLQVILHELAHAAGDVIPPDGGNPAESVRNQHRITRACLPEVYERIVVSGQ